MHARCLIAIILAFILSGSWLGAMPAGPIQTRPENTTGQREAKEAKGKKPDPEAQNQKKKATAATSGGRGSATAEARASERKRKKLAQQATQALEDAIWRAKKIQNPVVRMKVRALAADALWDYREEMAREILSEDFRGISSITVPQEDENKPPTYKKRKLEDVKAGLKKELMAIISSHDPALTHSLLTAEKSEKDKDENGGEAGGASEMLSVAIDLSTTNTEAASRIIKDSLKTEISPRLAFSLIALRQSAPVEASAIFNEALAAAKASGDLWEFFKLTPYVLPAEPDRFKSGSYLADPRRAKDAQKFIEYASVLLVKQLGSTQGDAYLSPDMVANEAYLWRSLLQLFNDLMPDKTWMVNTRIGQLAALRTEPTKKRVESPEPPSVENLLKKRIAEAEAATGQRRDNLFSAAAFAAMRLEDFDQAISLIEKVENPEQKDIDGSFILDKASRKALHNEGPDKALEVASKITWPSTRVHMFSRIVDALRSLGKRGQADTLIEELHGWLSNYEKNADKVWGMLTYLDHFAKDDPERAFATLSTLVSLLNSVNLDPPANPWAPRLYWYPEFHDFRKSLNRLARTDFERASQEIQMLKNPEVFLLVQVALCGEYLKSLKQSPSPKATAPQALKK
ncbi:MAG TPA: hypothetical protein VE262_10155 [Blastocatellia bacterium]|nr:hypothetical protein [Blastocatellia bacterium]